MTTTCSGCPRCGCRDLNPVRPEDPRALQEGTEEKFIANLECANPKCGQRFRYTPGTHEAPRRAAL